MPTSSPPGAAVATEPAATTSGTAPRLLERLFWPLQWLFWLWLAMLSIIMSWAVDPAAAIAWTAIGFRMTSGFAITAAVHRLSQLPRLQRLARPLRWSLIGLATASLLVGSLLPLSLSGVTTTMVWMGSEVLGQVVPRLAAGIFWCSGYFAIELAAGLSASEIQLAQAAAEAAEQEARAMQLEATAFEHEVHRLQAQMNPHFLFNALNAIVACKDSPEDVARVTQDLAAFLRGALRDSRPLEPLVREVQALEHYLAVQQTRFGAKLDCRIVCDRAARGVMVPPMMIQPLLENAIAYGMQTAAGPLKVEVSARVAAGQLEVVVANSGAWVSPDPERSPGTGLKTLRKRLALLVGPAAEVLVETPGGHPQAGSWAGVRIVIRMPAGGAEQPRLIPADLPQELPA
jgi:hypothetical protein